MLLLAWFSAGGRYWLYWHCKNPLALEMMRSANFSASLCLYVICRLVWYYHGSLRKLLLESRRFLSSKTGAGNLARTVEPQAA